MPLWSHNTCDFALQAQFGPAYHLPNTAVCAGAEGRDACDVSTHFLPPSELAVKIKIGILLGLNQNQGPTQPNISASDHIRSSWPFAFGTYP